MEKEIKKVVKVPHSILQLTKGTIAKLGFCRSGRLFYTIDVTNSGEVGQAIFQLEEKASLFRRYINFAIKALDGDEPDDMIRWEKI